tara:strand:- start:745 stop:1182 length:438 start_codon:yes stop_codon:yes gene_type:complete
MKIWQNIVIILVIFTISSCSDIEDYTQTLDGNLEFNLIYTTATTIQLSWDNTESQTTTLNLQSFVFDPNEHTTSMDSATSNAVLQLGSFTNTSTTDITVTASLYYVFMLSDLNNNYYDCTESMNNNIMQTFELCQTYLYLWGIFN